MNNLIKSFFCTGNKPCKFINLNHCGVEDYKGFKIYDQGYSKMLVLEYVLINETVGVNPLKKLANKMIRTGNMNPEKVALDWSFKLSA